MSTAISPLAPQQVPDLPAIAGVRLATAEAGIRYAGRTDVLLALFDACLLYTSTPSSSWASSKRCTPATS